MYVPAQPRDCASPSRRECERARARRAQRGAPRGGKTTTLLRRTRAREAAIIDGEGIAQPSAREAPSTTLRREHDLSSSPPLDPWLTHLPLTHPARSASARDDENGQGEHRRRRSREPRGCVFIDETAKPQRRLRRRGGHAWPIVFALAHPPASPRAHPFRPNPRSVPPGELRSVFRTLRSGEYAAFPVRPLARPQPAPSPFPERGASSRSARRHVGPSDF